MTTIRPIIKTGRLTVAGSINRSLRAFLRPQPPKPVLVATLLLAVSLFQANVHAASYFISAAGPSGDGSGSSAANAADASTGEKYRDINQKQNSPGTVIVYAPGTYRVNPALSMFDGVTHQGSGVDSTIIKMADGAASGTFVPMWLADKGTISNFKFVDATIDFNTTQQPWWTKANKGMSMAFAFSTADHCTLQRLKFINMGSKKMESFPVFFVHGSSAKGNLHDNLIDSCIFTQPIAHGNTDGLTCIMMSDAEPNITIDTTNVVTKCQFLNLKAPEYSDLAYTQGCTCPVVTDCNAVGVDSLWFIEPGSQSMGNNVCFKGQTVQITGNTTVDSGPVALILMHHNGDFAGNVNIQKNTVGLTEHPYFKQGPSGPAGVAVAQYEPGNPPVGNITIQDNTFTAPLPKGTSPRVVSANPTDNSGKYFHVASIKVINNRFVNFPKDGSEFHVSKNSEYMPSFTQTGNTFASGVGAAAARLAATHP